jgi:hypothetical protein
MKTLFYEFLLEYYLIFIVEDWNILTKFGKICIYPAWFIRAIIMWILSPLYIVPFFIKRMNAYKYHKELYNKIQL